MLPIELLTKYLLIFNYFYFASIQLIITNKTYFTANDFVKLRFSVAMIIG